MNLRIRMAGPVLVVSLVSLLGQAQDFAPAEPAPTPLGDIARQIRAGRPPKHTTVITNDDLQKVDYNNGAVVTETPAVAPEKPATDAKTGAPADNSAPAKGGDVSQVVKRDEEFRARLQEEKQRVELLQRELTVTRQQMQIQASDYYRDSYGRLSDPRAYTEQQQKYQDDIAAKQKQLDDATQALDALKAEGRRAGVSPAILDP